MNKIKDIADEKRCLVFAEPYEILCAQNKIRSRHVSEDVIWNMITQFEVPLYSEGYNHIEIINKHGLIMSDYLEIMNGFNQDNPHHSKDLLDHCVDASFYIYGKQELKHKLSLPAIAAVIHDVGKIFTKTFTNFKGETTEIAHYYNHQNVGAYLALLFKTDWTEEERLFIAQLVCYHMQPYFNKTEAARRRWKEIWGDKLNDMIMLLHEADEYAH